MASFTVRYPLLDGIRLISAWRIASFSFATCLFLYALLEQAGQQYFDTNVGGVKILPHSSQLL